MVATTMDQVTDTHLDKPRIRHHALAMIAGLPKMDRHFYERDIEVIIDEAIHLGQVLYAHGYESARLTEQQVNAVRVAFYTQDFADIDAQWLEKYDEKRTAGQMPDAGTSQEAWWD